MNEDKTVILRSKDHKSTIYIEAKDSATGIWVQNEHGSVGIVAEQSMTPYLQFRGKSNSNLPALAVAASEDNRDVIIQIKGDGMAPAFLSLRALAGLMPPPQ